MKDIRLNAKILKQLEACGEGIEFFINNNLEGFPLNKIGDIKGDYKGFVKFIKRLNIDTDTKGNVIYEKDVYGVESHNKFCPNDNLIYCEKSNGFKCWKEFDDNGNTIHYKNSNGFEYWQEFDDNGNMVHYKDIDEFEYWQEFDNDNLVHHKDIDGYEYWQEFDNDNLVHHKDSFDFEFLQDFDEKGNVILFKTSNGCHINYKTEYYQDGQLKRYNDLYIPYFEK